MRTLGNVIWVIFGGMFICLHYFISSILLCLTLIGIPFGIQTFKLASLAIWPFGREAVPGKQSSGCISLGMNVIWFFIGGIWLAIHHLLWALFFAVTIIGLPFAVQHVKLAGLALTPFGREIRDIPSYKGCSDPAPSRQTLQAQPSLLETLSGSGMAESPLMTHPIGTPLANFQKTASKMPIPAVMAIPSFGSGVGLPMSQPRPAAVAGILFLAGEMSGNNLRLTPGQPLIIGREPLKSNVVISHPAISRTHVLVQFDPSIGQFLIQDLGSSHGVKVNGFDIGKGNSQNVPAGTTVELGPGTVIFRTILES